MKLFDLILDNVEEPEALDWLHGFDCWLEVPASEQDRPKYSRYIAEHFGVAMYYDYGADYYFFEDLIDED
jgi:hypothetical protein